MAAHFINYMQLMNTKYNTLFIIGQNCKEQQHIKAREFNLSGIV